MANRIRRLTFLLSLFFLATAPAFAQGNALQNISLLVRGNELFGQRLLRQVHSQQPDRNIAVSPISLTLMFAALRENGDHSLLFNDIGTTFGWPDRVYLSDSAHMFLAAFDKPKARPCDPRKAISRLLCNQPEGTWISNALFYRSSGKMPYPLPEHFVRNAQAYFGVTFVNLGNRKPAIVDLQGAGQNVGALPQVSSVNDLLILSATHLQTAWEGNTFSMSKPHQGEFQLASGELKQVEMLDSELADYRYAKSADFEAVSLPCNSGYMIAVLPAPGKEIADLETLLTNDPGLVDAQLKRSHGKVSMPTFHLVVESNLKEPIMAIGIRGVFSGLGGLVEINNSRLMDVAQKLDITVDRDGIHANSETVAGAVYGGVLMVPEPFHVQLNRPFLFLIRDRNTDALLFLGAVMDPTQQH